MTRKDWKRLDEWSFIKNAHGSNQKYLYYNNEGYIVLATSKLPVWRDRGKIIAKEANKSQALKFAKQYMRTH